MSNNDNRGSGNGSGAGAYDVPSGLAVFRIQDSDPPREVRLKVRATMRAFQALAAQVTEAGGTHEDYLQAVIQHVRDQAGVELDLDEADGLSDALAVAQVEIKKKAVERVRSLTSTG
jgi:regulator of protease activity HflC (stomatin/prohibitin superfamily)